MASECTVLQPGVSIKPIANKNDVEEILRDVYGLKCISLKELNGYDDKNYHVQVSEVSDNNYIQSVNESGYILKIVNSLDSKKPQLFEAQNELLLYLGKSGICCPKPIKNKSGQYYIVQNLTSGDHIVRLLEFINGSILYQVPSSLKLFYQSGRYVAQLDEALKNFCHSAYDNHKTVWHMGSVPQLSEFLFAIKDDSRKKMLKTIIEEFSEKVLPVSGNFEKGMIHGDFNEQNILVDKKNGEWFIKGVLDFGDSHVACYLFELAITMTYMMIQGKDIDVGGYVLAGYNSIRKLPDQEFKLLKICIAARLCQSLTLGAYSSVQDPKNEYVLVTAKPGWTLLEELWPQSQEKLMDRWKNVMDSYKVT